MRTPSDQNIAALRPLLQGRFSGWLIAALLLLAPMTTGRLFGAEVTASATVSRDTVQVGQPVQLRVQISGTKRATDAPDVNVDGLDIRYVGPQTQVQMFNFDVSMSVTHIYQVTPRRAGSFTIPGLQIEAEGRRLHTQPVALKVVPQGTATGKQGNGGGEPDQLAWAEVVLPRETAYVGETLPVELRLYVDKRVRWQLESMPTFEGEGFTKTKLTEPRQEQSHKDNREYDVVVVKTAVTPSKAGKIAIGPVDFVFNAQIPRARPNRSRSPFEDFFGDDFFNDPFGPFARTEQRKATSKPVELEVKPLPAAGRPASFSGAVGQFALSADGNPKSVKVGDPITMSLRISGRGNFDRLGAPVLSKSDGWRTYPPSSNYKSDDEVGISGVKSFEVAVIPEAKKTEMPVFEFSYFDPITEKYVTLNSGHIPLNVEGDAPAQPPARMAESAAPQPNAPPAATPPPAPTDIIGLRYDQEKPGAFEPLYSQRAFWMFQLLPLAGLAGLVGATVWKPNVEAGRTAALRRERSALMAKMRRETDRTAFYDHAARVLQIDTALVTGQPPEVVDATAVRRARQADAESGEWIDRIFDSRAEALYAGGSGADGALSDADRDRVLAVLGR